MRLLEWLLLGTILLLGRVLVTLAPPPSELPLTSPVSTTKLAPGGKVELASVDTCELAKPAVVTIYARGEIGSGSIISPNGLVLTSNHVVQGVKDNSVRVKTSAEQQLLGQVVASDPRNDLALVQLNAQTPLPTLSLAKSESVEVGQSVCAIGSPFNRPGVVTRGLLEGTRSNGDWKSALLLHPGNSGGPLLNAEGEMIGVNQAIWESASGENTGISFATNFLIVKQFVEQNYVAGLKARYPVGTASTPSPPTESSRPLDFNVPPPTDALSPVPLAEAASSRLGVTINDLTLIIQTVEPDSPAERAGLVSGDRAVAINGTPLVKVDDLEAFLSQAPVSATLTILRGQTLTDIPVNFTP